MMKLDLIRIILFGLPEISIGNESVWNAKLKQKKTR